MSVLIRPWQLAALGLIGLCGCQDRAPGTAQAPAQVQRTSLAVAEAERIRGTCVIKPAQVVRLKSQLAGEVRSVNAMQGDAVRRGQILATVNTEELRLRRLRTGLELQKLMQREELLRFQIQRAEKEFSVVRELSKSTYDFVPRFGKEMATLTERRAELKDNLLSQALSRIDLRTTDESLRKSDVRAPFDGVVLARSVEPGMVIGSGSDTVGGGDVLFEIADLTRLGAACIVKEADAMRVLVGKTVSVIVEGAARERRDAKIEQVSPVISNEAGISRREFRVRFAAADINGLLPGMNAEIEFDERELKKQ
jgi:multidrug efflux pump subunit AcrA (membrane-fusion protein)